MDPSSNNWFEVFVENFRFQIENEKQRFDVLFKQESLIEFCHLYLHVSGLFFGYAKKHQICTFTDSDSWTDADHFKIMLSEGLLLTYLFTQKDKIQEDNNIIDKGLRKLFDFYVLFSLGDTNSQAYLTTFEKNKTIKTALEKVIDLRVSSPTMLKKEFWKGSQFNLFAGLDMLYFALWLQNDYSYDRRKAINQEIVWVVAHSKDLEKISEKNGQALYDYMLSSSENFTGDDILDINKQSEIDFQRQAIQEKNIIRQLIYEYAVFTCLVDNSLNVSEILFLNKIARLLNISEEAAQQSIISIENFLINNGNDIFFLQYGDGLSTIKQAFVNRCSGFLTKNKKKIIKEILESKELVALLRKSMREDLTEEEIKKVKEQIFDILKTIPSLAIFMLPGAMVIYPILIKILPEEVLIPSSFRNKKE